MTGARSLTVLETVNFAAATTVASAGTTNIGAELSNFVIISGTTGITSFGTANAGILRYVRFSGALTLTHNGTSLILPTAANITTVAGDTAVFVSEGSGNWRCLGYTRASGAALSGYTAPTSVVRVNVCNGQGSTNTRIRRFTTTLASSGSDITYADSASLGASFTINTTGTYSLHYSENINSAGDFGISLNSSQLSTSIRSITAADRVAAATTNATDNTACCSVTLRLNAGDVVRPHVAGAYGNGAFPAEAMFSVARIS